MFCIHCGKPNKEVARFCGYCGKPMYTAPAAPAAAPVFTPPKTPAPAAPVRPSVDPNTVLYQGVCLKRESAAKTLPGDAVITYQGLAYYKRSSFKKTTGKKPCDFFVDSQNVASITTARKNMNDVMELHMKDGTTLEFYSPDFAAMLSAMQTAIKFW